MIGNKIKEFAENQNIKFEDLAEKAGLSRTTVYSIARGSSVPTLENAYKIAKALNSTVQELFFEN